MGDILVQGEKGAQVMTTPEMATFLAGALTTVRTVPVRALPAPLTDLRVPAAGNCTRTLKSFSSLCS